MDTMHPHIQEALVAHERPRGATAEQMQLFRNTIILIVQQPNSAEKQELIDELEAELHQRYMEHQITLKQRYELLLLLSSPRAA